MFFISPLQTSQILRGFRDPQPSQSFFPAYIPWDVSAVNLSSMPVHFSAFLCWFLFHIYSSLRQVLFELARYHAPSTIFLDELESVMSQRGTAPG